MMLPLLSIGISVFVFILIQIFASVAVDLATSMQVQDKPAQSFTFNGGDNKTIESKLDENVRSVFIHLEGQIDTGVTAPGRSADSPYDMIQSIRIVGGETDITYNPHSIRAIAETFEQQAVLREDKPTVATSQTDDEFGFTVILPAPMLKGTSATVKILFNTAVGLDASSGSNYSNFDGTGYVAFLQTDEAVEPAYSYDDEDDGTGSISLTIPSNVEISFLHMTNENGAPSAPSAGNDEVKYESTLTDITFKTQSQRLQYNKVPIFKMLEYAITQARNNVSYRAGHFCMAPKTPIKVGSNNRIDLQGDGTTTKSKLFVIGSPPTKDTK